MNIEKRSVRKHTARYIQILIGCALTCLGFNLFLIPAHLLTGGVSGIALIVYYMTGLPVGLQNLVYNLPILYLAYRVFGRLYAIDTVIGTVCQSLLFDATHFMVDWAICDDAMLCAIFGGVIAGVGFGMVFRANANTGGLDVVGAVVRKFYSIDMGTAVFALNFLIIMASVALFNINIALFSFVSIYVTAELTNRVATGLNREKSVVIISPQSQAICMDIMGHIHRGVTFIDGRGGFAGERKDILFIVVSLTQVSRVKTIAYHHDPQAFMIVSDTSEVSGKGFTLECESYEEARCKWEETHRQGQSAAGYTPNMRRD